MVCRSKAPLTAAGPPGRGRLVPAATCLAGQLPALELLVHGALQGDALGDDALLLGRQCPPLQVTEQVLRPGDRGSGHGHRERASGPVPCTGKAQGARRARWQAGRDGDALVGGNLVALAHQLRDGGALSAWCAPGCRHFDHWLRRRAARVMTSARGRICRPLQRRPHVFYHVTRAAACCAAGVGWCSQGQQRPSGRAAPKKLRQFWWCHPFRPGAARQPRGTPVCLPPRRHCGCLKQHRGGQRAEQAGRVAVGHRPDAEQQPPSSGRCRRGAGLVQPGQGARVEPQGSDVLAPDGALP